MASGSLAALAIDRPLPSLILIVILIVILILDDNAQTQHWYHHRPRAGRPGNARGDPACIPAQTARGNRFAAAAGRPTAPSSRGASTPFESCRSGRQRSTAFRWPVARIAGASRRNRQAAARKSPAQRLAGRWPGSFLGHTLARTRYGSGPPKRILDLCWTRHTGRRPGIVLLGPYHRRFEDTSGRPDFRGLAADAN